MIKSSAAGQKSRRSILRKTGSLIRYIKSNKNDREQPMFSLGFFRVKKANKK
jgi:phage antirepressor YoqD-like protein